MVQRNANAATGRTRTPPQGRTAPQGNGDTSWMGHGAAGVNRAQEEAQAANERRNNRVFMPFRFWLEKGHQADIIILDHDLESVPFFFEHNLKDADGKYSIHETCPKEFSNCPLCEIYGESYYVMLLSILDLRGYTAKKGTREERHVGHSKKLMPVKTGQIADFGRLAEAAIRQHGTMRGMQLLMNRDDNGQSTRIGTPAILDNGSLFAMVSEDELNDEFGNDAVYSQQNPNQVVKAENADITPYDFGTLFPKPDAEDLRRRYGGAASPGSRAESAGGYSAPAVGNTQIPQETAVPQQTRTRTRAAPAAAPAAAAPPAAPAAGTRSGVQRRAAGGAVPPDATKRF